VHHLGNWPELVITSLQRFIPDGGTLTISGTVAIHAKLLDNAAQSGVTYALEGASHGAMTSRGTDVRRASWNSDAVARGIHSVTVTASDARGRTRRVASEVKVWRPAP
jgi:hypothetical protein